jgi:thioester reductase-like protein
MGISSSARILHRTSTGFDVSIWELAVPVAAGATQVVTGETEARDVSKLLNCVARTVITHVHFVPSIVEVAVSLMRSTDFTALKCIICSGEELTESVATAIMGSAKCKVLDFYGPTETTIDVLCYICVPGDEYKAIGFPVHNTQVHASTDEELLVSGIQLAAGYVGRPRETSTAFCPLEGHCGRTYRTNDQVSLRQDGAVVYRGRFDFQVKIRGNRVELCEIDAVLESVSGVSRSVTMAIPRSEKSKHLQLVAFVRLDRNVSFDQVKDRGFDKMKLALPEYMHPSRVIPVALFPTTTSGKLDRGALKSLATQQQPTSTPRTSETRMTKERYEVCSEVAAVWKEVLSFSGVVEGDVSFFDVGGDSLYAVLAILDLNSRLGVSLQPGAILDEPVFSRFVSLVEEALNPTDPLESTCPSESPSCAFLREAKDEAGSIVLDAKASGAVWIPPRGDDLTVFVTGAVGFIGCQVVRHLLLDANVSSIICLVRPQSAGGSAMKRLQNALRAIGCTENLVNSERLHAYPGDVSQSQLGLQDEDFHALSKACDLVIHMASAVHFLTSFKTMHPVNVGGTLEIIRFAVGGGRLSAICYVSTMAVLGSLPAGETIVEDDWSPSLPPDLSTAYAETKYIADCMVRSIADLGVPTSVVRPGSVVGDSATGQWNVDDMLVRIWRTCTDTGYIPSFDTNDPEFDMTCVDDVAHAIIVEGVACATGGESTVLNLSSQHPIPWSEFNELLVSSLARKPLMRPFSEWCNLIGNDSPLTPMKHVLGPAMLRDLMHRPVARSVKLEGLLRDPRPSLTKSIVHLRSADYLPQLIPELELQRKRRGSLLSRSGRSSFDSSGERSPKQRSTRRHLGASMKVDRDGVTIIG